MCRSQEQSLATEADLNLQPSSISSPSAALSLLARHQRILRLSFAIADRLRRHCFVNLDGRRAMLHLDRLWHLLQLPPGPTQPDHSSDPD